jgi:HEAT repeat protein
MNFSLACVVGLFLLFPGVVPAQPVQEDAAKLREMLRDRRHPALQSQAALLLVMSADREATETVRLGLRQADSLEMFQSLTTALRLRRDARFNLELFTVLSSGRAEYRRVAADAFAHLCDDKGVERLKNLATDPHSDAETRHIAVRALAHSGRKNAAAALVDLVADSNDATRQAAIDSLTFLTGQTCGADASAWKAWWDARKDLSSDAWVQERFSYQSWKARRLEEELERARAEIVRLHQQIYSRLPAADRLGHVQAAREHEDPAVRAQVVAWCLELLPAADGVGQRVLADVLLALARDPVRDVQRPAILALGRVNDARSCDLLCELLKESRAPMRVAAARALTQQATLARPEKPEVTRAIQHQVVPALKKALEDPALEVVVEAAEDLGSLGLPEAVPLLCCLLKHPSEPVRQTAAQALERVADAGVLNDILAALDESAVTVRFSLVGALGHIANDGKSLPLAARARLINRLEELLARDTDPGVRSRAATVLGECAPPTVLPTLWKRVQVSEDSRVQEKAWAAFVRVIVRANDLELLTTWEKNLADAHDGARHLQLVAGAVEAWKKAEESAALVVPAEEALVQAQLQQNKWAAGLPVIRELLAQPGSDSELTRRLRWLHTAGEQALKEGNKPEALRVVQDAQAFLPRCRTLVDDFERLQKQAK